MNDNELHSKIGVEMKKQPLQNDLIDTAELNSDWMNVKNTHINRKNAKNGGNT